jgi:hypothetical protein
MRKIVLALLSIIFVMAAGQAVAKGQKSRTDIKDINVSKTSDSASTPIMRKTGGSSRPKGKITVRKAGKGQF